MTFFSITSYVLFSGASSLIEDQFFSMQVKPGTEGALEIQAELVGKRILPMEYIPPWSGSVFVSLLHYPSFNVLIL